MANNPWDFSDAISNGVNSSMNLKKIKLEEENQRQGKIKEYMTRIDNGVDKSLKVMSMAELPAAVKLENFNSVFVPAAKTLYGLELSPLDSWPEFGAEFSKRFMAVKEAQKKGEIDGATARASFSGLMAEYAGKVPESIMDNVSRNVFPKGSVQTFPDGPEGAQSTEFVNEFGERSPIAQGTPKSGGPSPADKRKGAIDNIRKALATKNQVKEGGLSKIAGLVTTTEPEKRRAQLDNVIAMNAQELGLTPEQSQKLLRGELGPEELELGTPAAAPAPTGAPAPKKMVSFNIGGKVGQIPEDQVAAFQKKYPNAKRVK
jgi:hypothetical protein